MSDADYPLWKFDVLCDDSLVSTKEECEPKQQTGN